MKLKKFRKQRTGESDCEYFRNAVTKLSKVSGVSEFGNKPQSMIAAILRDSNDVNFLTSCYDAIDRHIENHQKLPGVEQVFRDVKALA